MLRDDGKNVLKMFVVVGWDENLWKGNDLWVKISDKVEMFFVVFECESRIWESERFKWKYRIGRLKNLVNEMIEIVVFEENG